MEIHAQSSKSSLFTVEFGHKFIGYEVNIKLRSNQHVLQILSFRTFFKYYRSGLMEGVDLALPPDIFSVHVKSGACYITGPCGRVQNKIKETLPQT